MKLNYQWLKELVDVHLSPRDLAARLTMVGLAVDSVEKHGQFDVLELDLTSNRPDCLSHLGVAREVSAITETPLHLPSYTLAKSSTRTSEVASAEIHDATLCPRYTARVIRGVKVAPSPDWLVEKLESVGLRAINNVADITNYVLLEMGHPLHAFDLNKLSGRRVVIRCARVGERLTTLDGVKRELMPEMLVIADAERPVAIAGIMGGADSEISDKTTDVLLESAYFAPSSIRQTTRALGLSTEASYRFERGTDYEIVVRANDRAAAMIAELAGGEVLDEIIDIRGPSTERYPIVFRPQRYQALIGLKIELEQASRILSALGLEVEIDSQSGFLRATAPSWRNDLAIEEDLIEEIVRINGYDKLEMALPGGAGAGAYLTGESERRNTRQTLIGMGYHEAISFNFVNTRNDRMLSQATDEARLTLNNPIDETQSQMRTTLLVGLLDAMARNINHGVRNISLFEVGKCFEAVGEMRPREIERLGLVLTGARNECDWQSAAERVDFYDLKGAVEALCENLGKKIPRFVSTDAIAYLHPGRAAIMTLDGKEAGYLGQLHPKVTSIYKFKQVIYVAELDFGMLLDSEAIEVRYRPLPKYQAVTRDLSLLIADQVTFADIERLIGGLAISELISVRLFDLYTGKELPSSKRSLALSLRYRADDRTLTEAEINAAHNRIVTALIEELAAEIR